MTEELPIRWCIGCGRTTVRGRTYCARCRRLLRQGLPVDLHEVPTIADLERAREAELRQRRAPLGFNLKPRCA